MTDAAKPSRISSDTKWIIGNIVPAILVVAGLLSMQIAGLNSRLDRLETDVRGLDSRVRAVEITLGQVLQHLEAIERVILPAQPSR